MPEPNIEDIDDLIEYLVRELAINDWKKGLSVTQLLDRIETFYDIEERHRAETEQDAPGEEDPENPQAKEEDHSNLWKRPVIDHAFQVRVWDTLVARDDVIVGPNRAGNCDLTLDETLALPVEESTEEFTKAPKGTNKDQQPPPAAVDEAGETVVYQPRIHVAQRRLWLILTGHDVDKAKLPFSEWQLLLAIVAAGKNGILQADAGKQTGQDKRSVPRRTDFLFQKGYINKKQVLAHSQKTSLLTHKMYLEDDRIPEDLPDPSKLPASVLTQDLKPVPGHEYWTGAFVDTEMVARAALAVIRAWGVIRRTHILAKMNVTDLRLRKTLERTMRKFFELKVAKRVSAILPDNPKIFKDCVKFLREPTEEEWAHFKKRLTSQGFKNRPSRAKPKSEHKPRVRRRASGGAKKGKKTLLDDSSGDDVEEDAEDSDENDDFFSGDDGDETFDAAAKPTLMTSAKASKEELENMVEEAIEAIPGVDGVTEEDLLLEIDGVSVEDLHALFEPLNNPAPKSAEIMLIHLVREAIQKARQDTFQYYTAEDFQSRVRAGESTWEGVDVARFAFETSALTERAQNISEQSLGVGPSDSVSNPSRVGTPQPPALSKSGKGKKKVFSARTPRQGDGSPTRASGGSKPSKLAEESTAAPRVAANSLRKESIVEQTSLSSGPSTPAELPAAPTPKGTPRSTPKPTPKATPSIRLRTPPKKPRGRPKRPGEEQVTFTSEDQVQREAGVPGVYMDIPEFTQKLRGPPRYLPKGQRKTKKFMVLFKSNRLKELDFSPREPEPHVVYDALEESATPEPNSAHGQHQTRAMSVDIMGTPGVDISSRAETPNRSFLGSVAGPGPSYQSPYQGTPVESSMLRPASPQTRNSLPQRLSDQPSYSSPYGASTTNTAEDSIDPVALDFVVAAIPANAQSGSQAYQSPYPASSTPAKQSSVRASARRASKIATTRLQATAVQEYQSPYAQLPDESGESPEGEIVVQPRVRKCVSQARDTEEDDDGDVAMTGEEPPNAEEAVQLSEEQLKLDVEINAAANEIFPDQAVKLAVSKDGVVGNLCVDMESTRLVFFPLDIMDMDAKIDMNAALISKAVVDEEAFKLTLTMIDPENQVGNTNGANTEDNGSRIAESSNTMVFSFASTSINVAKNIRGKIMWGIAARALKAKRDALPAWAFPVSGGGPKPFVCDTCGGTWKNYEGIKYHKTKAKSACNTSYVRPPTPPPGEEVKKKRRKGYYTLDELPPDEAARIAARGQQDGLSEEQVLEDSIIEDGEMSTRRAVRKREPKSFRGMDVRERSRSRESDYREKRHSKSPKKTKKAAKSAANKVISEATAAQDITAATPEKRVLLAAKTKLKYPTTNDRDNIERRTGQVVTQQRKDIIMELVDANGGAFPGDQGLWYAMHAAWMERYPHSNIQDYKYCNQAVALLEDQGMLIKLKFSFRDQRGRMRTRSVVTKVGVDPMSPEVAAIKDKIKEVFPRYYCPPDFAPPTETMIMLEGRESRPSEEERQKRQLEKERLEDQDPNVRQAKEVQALQEARVVATAAEVVQPPKQMGGARRRRDSSSDEEIAFLNAPFYHPEPDAEGQSDNERPSVSIAKQKPKSDKTYIRTNNFREGQSFRMKALWASLKERGSSLKAIDTNEDLYLGENALIVDESDGGDDDEWSAMNPVLGVFSHAFMQSTDGSWSAEVVPKLAPTASQMHVVLPEPITYMQQRGNSAWSFRPFGHGADPIYARSSKQLPRQPHVCNKDSTFRPIIISARRLCGGRRHPPNSEPSTKRIRSWHWSRGEDGPKKRARKGYYCPPEGGVFVYGYDDNGEELPWPDFKPMLLPPNRGARASPVMPSWSSNPGLGSLLGHSKATAAFSQASETRSLSRQLSEDTVLVDVDDAVMEDLQAPLELFSRSTASLKDRLPKDLDTILSFANESQHCNVPSSGDPPFYEINTVCAWERTIKGKNLLLMGSIEPGSIFINHTLECEVPSPSVPLVWSEDNHFTLETLPYQLLAYDPMEHFYPQALKPKRAYNKKAKPPHSASVFHGMQEATASDFEEVQSYNSRKRRLQDTYGNGVPRTKRIYRRAAQTKDFKVRRLTCLPSDIEGLTLPGRDPNFAIQISNHDITGHRKRTNERNVVNDALDDRLLVSVIVIRTLLGGLDQSVDWVLVSKLFPQCTMNWLHRHFNLLADKNMKRVEKLVEDFQDLYIKAYAADELPPLDYDHTLDYDWDTLIDWTMKRTQALATANVNLPANREDFNKAFEIHDTEERIYRDSYFNSALPVHKRIAHATAKNATLPLTPPPETVSEAKHEARRIARSWARASTLTPAATFDAVTTAAKLHSVSQEIMGDAIGQLLDGKVLTPVNKGRPVPGRGFETTDVFTAAFSRLLSRAHFEEAAAFKRKLDDAFRVGKSVTLEYTASEGEIMAATNLQAHGRTVQIGRNVPNNKFGLTNGNYQTRHMDKTRLLFDIDITPSPTYIYDAVHPLLISGVLDIKSHPPPKPLDDAIPLWYDINGVLIPGLWKKVVALVLSVIMNRTGADTKEITRLCKPVLEEWDVRLFIEWAYNVGIVKENGPGTGIEGWTVTEWWWWVGGQI